MMKATTIRMSVSESIDIDLALESEPFFAALQEMDARDMEMFRFKTIEDFAQLEWLEQYGL